MHRPFHWELEHWFASLSPVAHLQCRQGRGIWILKTSLDYGWGPLISSRGARFDPRAWLWVLLVWDFFKASHQHIGIFQRNWSAKSVCALWKGSEWRINNDRFLYFNVKLSKHIKKSATIMHVNIKVWCYFWDAFSVNNNS